MRNSLRFVVVAALFLCGPLFAQFNEGFESGNLTSGGWYVEGNIAATTAMSHTGSYSARSSNNFYLKKSFVRVTSGTLECTLYMLLGQTDKNACTITFWDTQDASHEALKVYPRYHGTFHATSGPDKIPVSEPYLINVWYKIRIVINVSARTYDVYLNDRLCAERYNFYQQVSGLDLLQLDCLETAGSVAYIDDIYLSATGSSNPVPPINPVEQFIEGFESGDLDTGGWIAEGNIAVTGSRAHTGRYSAQNINSFKLQKYFSRVSSGKLEFIVYVLMDQTDKNACTITFWDSQDMAHEALKVYPRYHGTFHATDGPDKIPISEAYVTNYWYKIHVVMDIDNRKYDVYINDILRASQYNFFQQVNGVDLLQFDCLETSGAMAGIDDIYLSAKGVPDGSHPPTTMDMVYNQIDATSFPVIHSYVSVVSPQGQSIQGLSAANFTVQENFVTETITSVTPMSGGSVPISVALLLDRSGSMSSLNKLADAKAAALTFLSNLTANDRAAVISFSDNSTVDQIFTTNKTLLSNAINALAANGNTALFDACLDGLNHTNAQSGRKAMIVLSDGADNASSATLDRVIEYANLYNIPLYVIGLGITSGSTFEHTLQQLANGSGGRYYGAPSSADLAQIYQLISQQLQSQYRITYTTHNQNHDGTLRNVAVRCTYQGQSITRSKTYQAPSSGNAAVPPLAVVTPALQSAGSSVWIDLYAGSDMAPVTDLFGLAFELNFSNTAWLDLATPAAANIVVGSFMGTANDVVFYPDVNETTGKVSVGLSRKAGLGGRSGSGVVLRLQFRIQPATPAGTVLQFNIGNLVAINSNGAPLAMNPMASSITVTTSALMVWPGDTDNNCRVDQVDILPLGLYWGKSGAARAVPTMAWNGQPCLPWTPELSTYADANGDGIVNQTDILAIGLNWGKGRTLLKGEPDMPAPEKTNASLSMNISQAAPAPNTSFTFNVLVSEIVDLFGIAFEMCNDHPGDVFIDSVLVAPWFSSDVVQYVKIDNQTGKVSIGLSRKAGCEGVTGAGALLQVKAHISSQAAIGTTVRLDVKSIVAQNSKGQTILLASQPAFFTITDPAAVECITNLPATFQLAQNYPNPFNAATRIDFSLPKPGMVWLAIYNIAGQELQWLQRGFLAAGQYSVRWNAKDDVGRKMPGGVYLVKLSCGNECKTLKMLYVP
jgi:VWFA-related protein